MSVVYYNPKGCVRVKYLHSSFDKGKVFQCVCALFKAHAAFKRGDYCRKGVFNIEFALKIQPDAVDKTV